MFAPRGLVGFFNWYHFLRKVLFSQRRDYAKIHRLVEPQNGAADVLTHALRCEVFAITFLNVTSRSSDKDRIFDRRGRLRFPFLVIIRQCRALSPTFPAGELVFFIPLRVAAGDPARRNSTGSGRLIDAAVADDVADFFLVIIRIAAAMELGRSERARSAAEQLRGRRRRRGRSKAAQGSRRLSLLAQRSGSRGYWTISRNAGALIIFVGLTRARASISSTGSGRLVRSLPTSVLENCRRRWQLAGRVDRGCRCRRVAARIELRGHRQTLADSAAAPRGALVFARAAQRQPRLLERAPVLCNNVSGFRLEIGDFIWGGYSIRAASSPPFISAVRKAVKPFIAVAVI
jgi:hypothetical protein